MITEKKEGKAPIVFKPVPLDDFNHILSVRIGTLCEKSLKRNQRRNENMKRKGKGKGKWRKASEAS